MVNNGMMFEGFLNLRRFENELQNNNDYEDTHGMCFDIYEKLGIINFHNGDKVAKVKILIEEIGTYKIHTQFDTTPIPTPLAG